MVINEYQSKALFKVFYVRKFLRKLLKVFLTKSLQL
jgi:hypothetical protein